MNGAADLGGMMGFGPVVRETDEPLFHAHWERRVFALVIAAGATRAWTIDAMRFARESIPPAEYLSSSYYEIWLKAVSSMLVAKGLVTPEELRTGTIVEPASQSGRKPDGPAMRKALAEGTGYERASDGEPPFGIGQKVRARVFHPKGHTRLPRYVRGRQGLIERVHGVFVFPDASAHGSEEVAGWLFTVRFDGRELWGDDAEQGTSVSVDAWEAYLDPIA